MPLQQQTDIVSTVHYLCRGCEWRLVSDSEDRESVACENCRTDNQVVAPAAGVVIDRCGACGEDELYVQKDFNRATGVTLVVIGSIFVPWTWGLSLLAVTLVDFALYYYLKDVEVCYECRAVHRGYPLNPRHKPFDLVLHDRHVYGAAPPGAEEGHAPPPG